MLEYKKKQKKIKYSFSYRLKKDVARNHSLYLMILPVVVFYFIFCYIPMIGVITAFQDYDPMLGISGSSFVGFKHFVDFFNDENFFRVLKNTIVISLSGLIFGFPMPIILALLINELGESRFAKFTQTITYLPHFVSLVVIVGMIKSFTGTGGVINNVYSFFTGNDAPMLMNPDLFVPIYVTSNIWQGMGWDSIIYFAAITGVSSQLYEACEIDGGGKIRQMWSVTLPAIRPAIITLLIMRIGNLLTVGSEKVLLMYNPATYKVADVIQTFVYRKGLQEFEWSYGTAVGLFNSVINVILLILANKLSKKLTESSLW